MVAKSKSTAVAVKTQGSVVAFDPSKFKAGVANMKKLASRGATSFLRMDKSGDWYYGADNREVGDSIGYILPNGGVHGWQCWADTDLPRVAPELLESVMLPNSEPMPDMPDEVPENGREWAEAAGISMVLDGHAVTYTNTSLGGKNAIADYGAAAEAQYDKVGDDGPMVAKVQMRSDFYMHKKYGKTYFPIFNVIGWVKDTPAAAAEVKAAAAKKPAKPAPKAAAKKPAAKARRAA